MNDLTYYFTKKIPVCKPVLSYISWSSYWSCNMCMVYEYRPWCCKHPSGFYLVQYMYNCHIPHPSHFTGIYQFRGWIVTNYSKPNHLDDITTQRQVWNSLWVWHLNFLSSAWLHVQYSEKKDENFSGPVFFFFFFEVGLKRLQWP